jgi:hypothetical protein
MLYINRVCFFWAALPEAISRGRKSLYSLEAIQWGRIGGWFLVAASLGVRTARV